MGRITLRLLGVVVLAEWVLGGGYDPARTWGQPVPLLADRHKAAGVTCAGCHQERPPGAEVPAARCGQCHGDYARLAELTRTATPANPHESHAGELECSACHRAHKPSADYCGSCHNFGFKVP